MNVSLSCRGTRLLLGQTCFPDRSLVAVLATLMVQWMCYRQCCHTCVLLMVLKLVIVVVVAVVADAIIVVVVVVVVGRLLLLLLWLRL